MCSATASSGRRWDGSPARPSRSRALRVTPDSPTRLVRSAQPGRCPDCGNRIDRYPCADSADDGRVVPLHPQELPAAAVPVTSRWHVSSGTAHPAHDGSPWCRIPHATLCPAQPAPAVLTPQITTLRRHMALHTRRFINNGAFTPPAAQPSPSPTTTCRPVRPVIHLLRVLRLAPRPIDTIQCVSQTRQRRRCTRPVFDPDTPGGIWTLLPAPTAGRRPPCPANLMAVYDLAHLPYAEQLRWRHQHCPDHAAPGAADLSLVEWEPFDPLLHRQHIHSRLPGRPHTHRP
ncbi:DUF6083 domain-containing protein [Streptomyces sp. NBC_00887]|uniref:DUF6083 domain-containing protein n=1 Tax=Streptomyces sp. NBC_00887 TaxID=2975859 RepID=UPI003869D0A3|nr:DUF6083 domain-containing protein [Streptomyces sp. NBC_00887]WSY36202.1 DUF6083 domain-containing protein [Streptomyces sp. NBC_00887]